MSLDLYRDEAVDGLRNLTPMQTPEPGAFDGFVRGTGMTAMRGFAQAGSALHLLAGAVPVLMDAFTGGTAAQERYFRTHEEIYTKAVDFWTPEPGEVGVAGEVVGSLLSMIPSVIASPALAVTEVVGGTAEELTRKGVEPLPAVATGLVQGAGLGLGVWMPVLGNTAMQRILLGGVGFNVAQGVATRAVSEQILEGTTAEGQFEAFDPTALTLDVLLGAAFGTLAHLSPAQRAQGEQTWGRIRDWAQTLLPSQREALATLRQAQHLNVDSLPGKADTPQATQAHYERMRTAVNQLLHDEPVQVSDLPKPAVVEDVARVTEARDFVGRLQTEAQTLRADLGLPSPDDVTAPVTAEPTLPPPRGVPRETPVPVEAVPVEGLLPPEAPPRDPLLEEAQRITAQRPDEAITIGRDSEGQPIMTTVKQYLDDALRDVDQARTDAKLFEIAATCYLGRGA